MHRGRGGAERRYATWIAAALLSACRGASLPIEVEVDSQAAGGEAAVALDPDSGAGGEAASGGVEAAAGASSATASPTPNSECWGDPVTLQEIQRGRVRSGVVVSPGRLVASSQKFLLSEARSGSCLWAAFAARPGERGAGSGLLLVSFGAPHEESQACAAGSDGLPDDLAPGDLLEPVGTVEGYAPADCPRVPKSWQLRVDAGCPARQLGQAEPPEAETIEPTLADELASGRDPALLGGWGAALVRLDGVSARQDPEDGDAVFPFGVIRLEESSLEVHSRLYYFDLSGDGPKSAAKAPRFEYPTRFDSLTGLLLLDYCAWVVAPRTRCRDLSPASQGCADAE